MKYIIEFEDEPYMREDGVDYYTCKSARWYKLSETIINRLTPYTEPDRKDIEDEVWHLARTIESMSVGEIMNIFDVREENVPFLCNTRTYQEAKSKYEAWLKQKDEIHVGDEVLPMDTEYDTMIVTRTWKDDYWSDCVDTIGLDGSICSFLTSKVKKTGRHFPEVAELLEKMRGEEE